MASRPPNKRLGTKVARDRAEERGAEHTPDAPYYDIDDDPVVEVKSTKKTIENPSMTRKGRYQIIGDNHEQLVREGGVYDFILRTDDDHEVKTLAAEKVDQIINDAGLKWPKNSKLKLRYDLIHEVNE